ncbi:MAG: hypothetical protein NNA18_08560, partial [Nitrospira sp.]|nr:hypothetical protein [Nitrospira sp.]
KVQMYDLKTHEVSEVLAEKELYEDQLNVYAYIWKGLRGQSLNRTAIIATRLPNKLREALRGGNSKAREQEMAAWNPVVDLPINENQVARTIKDFGRCVDAIEDGKFEPRRADQLGKPLGAGRKKDHGDWPARGADREPTFAEIRCRTCDARFSCPSFRAYQEQHSGGRRKQEQVTAQDEETEREQEHWIEDNLAESEAAHRTIEQ